MRSINGNTIFMVDYETDTSVVHEYMTESDYTALLKSERDGLIKIMNHRNIGSVNKKA